MTFTPEVYDLIRQGCIQSARAVVPTVFDFFTPYSVVDVGGGEGWWAREFLAAGSKEALCIDESEQPLHRDGVAFLRADLASLRVGGERGVVDVRDRARPIVGPADLAICLEAAEHLPESHGHALVKFLADVAPVVVFSAAIPGQGGHGHINEQWPRYWADLFYTHGLVCSEYLRWEFWDDAEIEPWYRQNLLVFARHGLFDNRRWPFTKYPRAVVHPDIFAWKL